MWFQASSERLTRVQKGEQTDKSGFRPLQYSLPEWVKSKFFIYRQNGLPEKLKVQELRKRAPTSARVGSSTLAPTTASWTLGMEKQFGGLGGVLVDRFLFSQAPCLASLTGGRLQCPTPNSRRPPLGFP